MIDRVSIRQTYKEIVESYLNRGKIHTPYQVESVDELIDKLIHVATCPICSRAAVSTPYERHPVKYVKLVEGAKMPDKKYDNDAGYDMFAVFPVEISPGEQKEVHAGVAVEMPDDLWLEVRGKSSLNQSGILVFPGVIDAGFRGELSAFLLNTTHETFLIQRWQKFAQLVFHPRIGVHFISSKELSPSDRGDKGFGSTGKF